MFKAQTNMCQTFLEYCLHIYDAYDTFCRLTCNLIWYVEIKVQGQENNFFFKVYDCRTVNTLIESVNSGVDLYLSVFERKTFFF